MCDVYVIACVCVFLYVCSYVYVPTDAPSGMDIPGMPRMLQLPLHVDVFRHHTPHGSVSRTYW